MRALLVGIAGWAVSAALYLGFAGSTDTPELVAAAAGAAFVVGFVFWCRHARPTVMRTRASWLRIAPRVLRALGSGAIIVGGALLRTLLGVQPQSEMLRQPFDPGADTPRAAARRALAVLAASTAPDGYVVAVEKHTLELHRLVPRPLSPDHRWPI